MIKELAEIEGVAGVHIMAVEWERRCRRSSRPPVCMPRPAVA